MDERVMIDSIIKNKINCCREDVVELLITCDSLDMFYDDYFDFSFSGIPPKIIFTLNIMNTNCINKLSKFLIAFKIEKLELIFNTESVDNIKFIETLYNCESLTKITINDTNLGYKGNEEVILYNLVEQINQYKVHSLTMKIISDYQSAIYLTKNINTNSNIILSIKNNGIDAFNEDELTSSLAEISCNSIKICVDNKKKILYDMRNFFNHLKTPKYQKCKSYIFKGFYFRDSFSCRKAPQLNTFGLINCDFKEMTFASLFEMVFKQNISSNLIIKNSKVKHLTNFVYYFNESLIPINDYIKSFKYNSDYFEMPIIHALPKLVALESLDISDSCFTCDNYSELMKFVKYFPLKKLNINNCYRIYQNQKYLAFELIGKAVENQFIEDFIFSIKPESEEHESLYLQALLEQKYVNRAHFKNVDCLKGLNYQTSLELIKFIKNMWPGVNIIERWVKNSTYNLDLRSDFKAKEKEHPPVLGPLKTKNDRPCTPRPRDNELLVRPQVEKKSPRKNSFPINPNTIQEASNIIYMPNDFDAYEVINRGMIKSGISDFDVIVDF